MERLFTPADVAERCQISTKTVLRAIHAGRLKASRLGAQSAFRVRAEDVERWVESSVVARDLPQHGDPAADAIRQSASRPGSGRLVLTPDMGRRRSS
jgi:excisionase family DNA binding protein